MSTENTELSPLDAMIAQYEAANKPRFEKKERLNLIWITILQPF